MPPKEPVLKHIKSVKRGDVTYLYFNTGEKVDKKPVYVPLGKKGSLEVGTRYSAALAARTRRGGLPSSLTIPQLVQRYERSPDFTRKSAGTQKTYSVYLRRLATEFNNAPAGAFATSDVYALMDEMGNRPAAVDMLLLAGGQMFAWALKRRYTDQNPFDGIDREDWEARQYEPWPEAVVEEALGDPRLRLPVALLYFTGQRIGDCCNMKRRDIAGGEIHVVQQKTGKEVYLPIHSRLAAILADAPEHGETILADAKGRKAKDQTIRAWIAAFGAERGLRLVPHGLRKNAVNALLEAECSTAQVSAITGQSLKMVEHYARQRNNRRLGRDAIAKWEQAGNRETTGKILAKGEK